MQRSEHKQSKNSVPSVCKALLLLLMLKYPRSNLIVTFLITICHHKFHPGANPELNLMPSHDLRDPILDAAITENT